jgi:hypothetical protein
MFSRKAGEVHFALVKRLPNEPFSIYRLVFIGCAVTRMAGGAGGLRNVYDVLFVEGRHGLC